MTFWLFIEFLLTFLIYFLWFSIVLPWLWLFSLFYVNFCLTFWLFFFDFLWLFYKVYVIFLNVLPLDYLHAKFYPPNVYHDFWRIIKRESIKFMTRTRGKDFRLFILSILWENSSFRLTITSLTHLNSIDQVPFAHFPLLISS